MERAMRFELTTVTLARWGSTTELRSLIERWSLLPLPLTFQELIPAKLASDLTRVLDKLRLDLMEGVDESIITEWITLSGAIDGGWVPYSCTR